MNTLREKLTRGPWCASLIRRACANSSGAADGVSNSEIQANSAGIPAGRAGIPSFEPTMVPPTGGISRTIVSDVGGISWRKTLAGSSVALMDDSVARVYVSFCTSGTGGPPGGRSDPRPLGNGRRTYIQEAIIHRLSALVENNFDRATRDPQRTREKESTHSFHSQNIAHRGAFPVSVHLRDSQISAAMRARRRAYGWPAETGTFSSNIVAGTKYERSFLHL
jgi:hypothetical protein